MSEKNWSLEETIAKAMCHRSVGDVHAVDVNGKQRWNWYVDDARRFINAYGHALKHYGAVYDGKSWSIPASSFSPPEEFLLVPAKPTDEMIAAAKATTSAILTKAHATEIYLGMLAALPSQS